MLLDHPLQACQWDPRDRTRAGRHAGKSNCQHDWLCRQHNKFHQQSRSQKFIFFWRLKRGLSLNFCVMRKVRSWIEENILWLLFICKVHVMLYWKVLKVFNFKFLILHYPFLSYNFWYPILKKENDLWKNFLFSFIKRIIFMVQVLWFWRIRNMVSKIMCLSVSH